MQQIILKNNGYSSEGMLLPFMSPACSLLAMFGMQFDALQCCMRISCWIPQVGTAGGGSSV